MYTCMHTHTCTCTCTWYVLYNEERGCGADEITGCLRQAVTYFSNCFLIYTCTCTHTLTHSHTCTHTLTHSHTCTHTLTHMHPHPHTLTHMHPHPHTLTHMHPHTFTHSHTCTLTLTHSHTCIYTHMHPSYTHTCNSDIHVNSLPQEKYTHPHLLRNRCHLYGRAILSSSCIRTLHTHSAMYAIRHVHVHVP